MNPQLPAARSALSPVNRLMRGLCIATYLGGLLSLLPVLPESLRLWLQGCAMALLAVHLLEVLLVWRVLKREPQGLAHGVLQSLLFGLLYWWPLWRGADAPSPQGDQGAPSP